MKSSGTMSNAVKVKDELEDISLCENEDCASFQYVQFLQDNSTQTLVKKEEVHDSQLEEEINIEFESKDVKPTAGLFALRKLNYLSQNRTAIKDEPLDMVKKEYFDDNVQKLKKTLTLKHKNLKRLKCDKCPKSFSRKVGLELHKDSVHTGITYPCDICEKIFRRKGSLRVHINTLHTSNRKLYKCDECLKTFNYKCHLTYHIEYAHKGITHPCDLCRKVFISKTGIKSHKDSVHNGITYPCVLCEKVFSIKSDLKVHQDSVHKGIAHPCVQCEKSYARKKDLKRHIDRVHNPRFTMMFTLYAWAQCIRTFKLQKLKR